MLSPKRVDMQALMNLAINAHDAMGDGGELTIGVAEPFYTTREISQGVGLGLNIVYGIARQSGGFVAIDSAPGRGTTVNVFLPAAAQPAQESCMRRRCRGWRPASPAG